jgi:hypothetical protein
MYITKHIFAARLPAQLMGSIIRYSSKLLVFERKTLRSIFGPTKERDGTWRIKTNDELNKLIKNKAIINYIKSQRSGRFGHVYRMPDERMVKKVIEWKPKATR